MTTKYDPTKDPNYIEYGSDKHAALLGLLPDKGSELGWKLADMTAYGPQATKDYLAEVLRQKVNELNSGKPKVPKNAPSMFDPNKIITD